jgi:putative Mg2+ transporter-C (MgtC) family protein
MTLAAKMMGQIPGNQIIEFFLRVLAACVCGVAIGAERSRRYKEAGIRTHVLVACTACVLMILSKYGFTDLLNSNGSYFSGTTATDPARIAAQIVSGVGFLGAGVIFKTGNSIKGLTTAAGIWATAAIGMCFGTGMYYLGLFATVIIVILQFLMHKYPYGADGYTTNMVTVCIMDLDGSNRVIKEIISNMEAKITESGIKRNGDGSTTYTLTVMATSFITFEDCEKYMGEYPEIVSFDSFPVL